jgi:hypothetical protein
MNQQQLLQRIEGAWAALQESYAGLPEERMKEPGVTGDWSVKDILAHVTIWEEEALKHLPLIVEGGTPPRYSYTYGGIDAFNALMVGRSQRTSLGEVLRKHDEGHHRLIAYVEQVPEVQYKSETRFRRRLRLDTYSHYPIHTKAIREWRQLVLA